MNLCPFAITTQKGTLCDYANNICSRQSNKDCGIYADAVAEFKGLLDCEVEERFDSQFMKEVVYEY